MANPTPSNPHSMGELVFDLLVLLTDLFIKVIAISLCIGAVIKLFSASPTDPAKAQLEILYAATAALTAISIVYLHKNLR